MSLWDGVTKKYPLCVVFQLTWTEPPEGLQLWDVVICC